MVIGGPDTEADIGSPTYGLPVDLEPDLQNGGSAADGVALFALTADVVTAESIPVDTVIYDSPNSNELIDATGAIGVSDVDDASGGSSIERTSEGWVIQASPSPNDCSLLH